MEITAVKTHKVQYPDNLNTILDTYLPVVHERDIIIVTSKIVSICEGRVLKDDGTIDKYDLIKKESERYIQDPSMDKYHIMLTIKHSMLIASAGIDESNGNGYYVLWPQNPDKSADTIWTHLRKTHHVKDVGVLITDSKTTPLRWGTSGIGLSWCGFEPLNSYIGEPDIFGRNLRMTKASIIDGLAAAGVVVMGEGSEQTPIARIRGATMVRFKDEPPTNEERKSLRIEIEDDIYAPILTRAPWKSGI